MTIPLRVLALICAVALGSGTQGDAQATKPQTAASKTTKPVAIKPKPAPPKARAAASPALLVTPTRPVNGSLIRIAVARKWGCSARSTYAGTLAGQPLHFERDANGRCVALAAVPIDSSGSVTARVLREDSTGRVDTLLTRIPIAAANYPTERLRVAPQFGSTPDSALEARTDREAAQALDIARRAHDTPKLWRGFFRAPRPGRVTSGFGRAREFNGELQSRHMGTDFAGAEGTPVLASNRGVVALVADFYYGGRVVYLDHGAGLVTGHMHLSGVDVAEGDTVARGDVIGRVGSTGRVTGPHLHWIVRYGAVSVNPLSLLSLTKPPAPASRTAKPATARKRVARAASRTTTARRSTDTPTAPRKPASPRKP